MTNETDLQALKKQLLALTRELNDSVSKVPTDKILELSKQIKAIAEEIEKKEKSTKK